MKRKLAFKTKKTVLPREDGGTPPWILGVVDDDQHVHEVTRQLLRNFRFRGREVTLLHGYSGEDAQRLAQEHPGMAALLLDVVMETDHAGLDAVSHIRQTLHNGALRILLRTGQAGLFPEESVFEEYDINDYLEKADLTARRLKTALKNAFRAFEYVQELEQARLREQILRQAAEVENQERSTFIAGMGHELRSPSQSIMGFNDLVVANVRALPIDAKSRDEIIQYLVYTRSCHQRLMDLVNNLLDLSKIEAGRMTYDLQVQELNKAVAFACAELKPQSRERRIELVCAFGADACFFARFDMGKTIQIMINLLNNAVKFSPEGGTITIGVEEGGMLDGQGQPLDGETQEGFFRVTIQDQGPGVDEDEKDLIFAKYRQSRKNRTEHGGTGLGLSLTREFVQAQGGRIGVVNRVPGPGACFMFTLPRAGDQDMS